MDYNYESLLDQRFQMLCQSLLSAEYQNIQCFPIGMADGGRDATSRTSGRLETVFQVKFTRNPGAIKDKSKWIIDALEGEKEKIEKLVERGATKYVIITNVPPTASLDSGTIDKVDKYLADHVPIEAYCWWRDDLDRRLDREFDLKLRYPTLLSGVDMLRLLWENLGSHQDSERRHMALTAYFAHQAEIEATIRFKQAELLPSSLLNLFIDVPAAVPTTGKSESGHLALEYARHLQRRAMEARDQGDTTTLARFERISALVPSFQFPEGLHHRELAYVLESSNAYSGAAELLMDENFMENCPAIVLEGAPGQGKSTLSQYLAQIHRLRILSREDELRQLPQRYTESAILIPFKIELRDLASWMKGQNPWSGAGDSQHDKPRTLEAALAGHIERYSGGLTFDVSDVAFVARERPVLLILDALDEVADLEDRHQVVEEVSSAITRLRQVNSSLKVLITSRPTAVTGAPSFSRTKFHHLSLAPIPQDLALEYADKWGTARKLNRSDIVEISHVLKQKMSAPHMAELAKNTMQLSILLSLIYHRGSSLPDKRTELYDAYIASFFNREVEKSQVVRKNRMLLISLHQHLAYYMHARAESNRTTGRINFDELKRVVTDYLAAHKEPSGVLDDLLTGMVERVVALVSRVEGTYEFEVQPLREYFAARYLYDTAPYVPATSVGRGTKPDRFEGIARNPYWMNVTRFFAGCFTVGELLDLAERVCALCDEPDMAGSTYPRSLALSLLQDWVFSQSKVATEKVIDKVFDSYGIRSAYMANSEHRRSPWSATSYFDVSLSPKTGSTYLTEQRVAEFFVDDWLSEHTRAVAFLLGKQPESKVGLQKEWMERFKSGDEADRLKLLRLAKWAELNFPTHHARSFQGETSTAVLLRLHAAGWPTESIVPISRHRELILAKLNGPDQFDMENSPGALGRALLCTSPALWSYRVMDSAGHFMFQHMGISLDESTPSEPLTLLTNIARPLYEGDDSLTEGLASWRYIVHKVDAAFGANWSTFLISLISASVTSPRDRGAGADEFFSEKDSLVDRVRNARRRAKDVDWWSSQLKAARGDFQRERLLAAAYCWADVETLRALWDEIESVVDSLSEPSFLRLEEIARVAASRVSRRAGEVVQVGATWLRKVGVDSRMLTLFFHRFPAGAAKDRILSKRISGDIRPLLAQSILTYAWDRRIQGVIGDAEFLSITKKFYRPEIFFEYGFSLPSSITERRALREVAEQALKNPDVTSDGLMHAAEQTLRSTSRKPKPVLRIAEKEKWFS
ncbi:NACHT domain-containing protein [Streptomyces microflavus]|uniref:NACHT domain-containing protein n=1 Tax=Streptomyces microflavus TaxID=1919 RepID=UPI00367C6FD0